MKTNNPKDVADFICGGCKRSMCRDCMSMAGELEYLSWARAVELMGVYKQIEALKRENEQLRRERDSWKEHACLSLSDLWKVCLESEIYKRATTPKPTARDKKLAKMLKEAERLIGKMDKP